MLRLFCRHSRCRRIRGCCRVVGANNLQWNIKLRSKFPNSTYSRLLDDSQSSLRPYADPHIKRVSKILNLYSTIPSVALSMLLPRIPTVDSTSDNCQNCRGLAQVRRLRWTLLIKTWVALRVYFLRKICKVHYCISSTITVSNNPSRTPWNTTKNLSWTIQYFIEKSWWPIMLPNATLNESSSRSIGRSLKKEKQFIRLSLTLSPTLLIQKTIENVRIWSN